MDDNIEKRKDNTWEIRNKLKDLEIIGKHEIINVQRCDRDDEIMQQVDPSKKKQQKTRRTCHTKLTKTTTAWQQQ